MTSHYSLPSLRSSLRDTLPAPEERVEGRVGSLDVGLRDRPAGEDRVAVQPYFVVAGRVVFKTGSLHQAEVTGHEGVVKAESARDRLRHRVIA